MPREICSSYLECTSQQGGGGGRDSEQLKKNYLAAQEQIQNYRKPILPGWTYGTPQFELDQKDWADPTNPGSQPKFASL